MTYYLQPGIPHGWDDPRLLERFPHYRNLSDGKAVAFYKIAKMITVPDLDSDLSIDDLLQMHADARVQFRDEVAKMQTLEEFEQAAVPADPSFLDLKIKLAKEYLKACNFCENQCGVDRTQGQLGKCGVPAEACVAWTDIGMGEESILVPSGGLFFYGCTLKCVFCQNFNFSQEWRKKELDKSWFNTPEEVGEIVRDLCAKNVKNINLVGGDPTSDLHVILEAMKYIDMNICFLWNSNFYNSAPVIDLLLDVMDIWLPDWKFGDDACAERYSKVSNYVETMKRNFQAVHEERKGEIIIRHLVMPGHVDCCSKPILDWIAKHLPKAVVNIMEQYFPAYHAPDYPEIDRRPTAEEMKEVWEYATDLGIVWEPATYIRGVWFPF